MRSSTQAVLAVWTQKFIIAAALCLSIFSASAQDKIIIRGSNTIGEELAPHLITEYKKTHANVTFDLESKGTSYGIGSLMGGYCDIAGASKPVGKEQEEIAQIRGVHFKDYVLGSYTVSVLVNPSNPINDLTSNQVQSLFTGKIQNWKKLGGADAPVHLLIRDPISGTHLGFKEVAMAFQDYGDHIQLFTNYSDIASAIAKDPYAIGYTGLNTAPPAGTKILSIGGIAPTPANITAHKYPYVRDLHFYTDADKQTAPTVEFLNFVLSPNGQQVLSQLGYGPKP